MASNKHDQQRTASRISRKSEDERSNGNSGVIYARLGTMHHASRCRCCRCCRRRSQCWQYTIGHSAVWAMHWPICRSSPKSRRFTVEHGSVIDAGSSVPNLTLFRLSHHWRIKNCHVGEGETASRRVYTTRLHFSLLPVATLCSDATDQQFIRISFGQ